MNPPPENLHQRGFSSRDILTLADRLIENATGVCDCVVIVRTPEEITIRDNSGKVGLMGEALFSTTKGLLDKLFPAK